jgi:hypothetical protein
MDWDHQPNATLVRSLPAPTPGEWYDIDVTDLYRGWTSGAIQNYGIRLDPHFVSNRFNMFRSSRYTEDAYRPLLELKFAPPVSIPEFKMPLPSDAAWLVTTEVGGFDCIGPRSNGLAYPNPTHAGSKYFAIDFGWDNIDASRKRLFPKPSAGGEIPVLAAAGGRAIVPRDGGPNSPNGYHVILDHDGDGDVGTGFQTWYVHLAAPPTVYHEQEVEQGQRLGLMGSTGRDANGRPTSTDDHLHFAVKYRNRGDAPELAYVVLDSLLLKSYQTECAGGTYSRYYLSSNHEARAGALPIPKFTFSGDGKTGSSGQTVPFSVAPGGTIRITFSGGSDQSGVSYAWTINGSAVSTSTSFSRNFGVGNYTVVLKVTNSAGLTGTTSAIVGVTGAAAPAAAFTLSGGGKTGSSGQTVPFSVAPGGTIRITFSGGSDQSGVSYAWTINGSAVSTSTSFSRNFGVGNYTVVLKVTNSAGLTGTTSAIVGVR